ncbi:aldehyde oxygenase (deformylating) [Arthrospira platensis]|jgi:fatty aldehyde decarbonylase|uniref:Aldehyde decarbonylase n=2 Tax=Limnospira platensis TaxID=118562 RepID=A0A5M3T7P9_LIMPL|nr:aldehyde oxygenase (deformylating) [Arthrospira platensis]AMW30357.1 long-chain fatty aldehyde decarbonylase [Arthrospira platensis YZ]MBD2668081.1 aldehyde oxygenase (deformylating) [Arthrospira platensis FACHB-439]MBD2709208.1 aldehyde oxygenase (deformylating) [Arthrospira platensis FACHB-835]MDF2207711.1 aldehyde oxygenase (deformylating) [Arthrospira platensis NCB002]MDT9181412.1 aldehyde oxygenase (deformylating) [Limnospira sp. PMC 289.06]MDT9293471.1 aldehyde oxygenase (deformylati
MPQLETIAELDFQNETYKDAYSRINAIVIEGEQEAYDNYIKLGEMLPEEREELIRLSKMEKRHMKGFQACGRNLEVSPDMDFGREFFAQLHGNFQKAAAEGKLVTCLLIQSLIIESFAIAAYNIYIPVADPFARKITEGVVKDEYEHLNFGEEWLKAHFEESKAELEEANRQNLPLVWKMLNQVEKDASILGMEKEALIEDFMIAYGEALSNIGFTTRDIMRMSAYGLAGV